MLAGVKMRPAWPVAEFGDLQWADFRKPETHPLEGMASQILEANR